MDLNPSWFLAKHFAMEGHSLFVLLFLSFLTPVPHCLLFLISQSQVTYISSYTLSNKPCESLIFPMKKKQK